MSTVISNCLRLILLLTNKQAAKDALKVSWIAYILVSIMSILGVAIGSKIREYINKDVLLWFLFWILWITSANIIGIFYQNKQGIYNTKGGNLIITGSNLDLLYISIFILATIIVIIILLYCYYEPYKFQRLFHCSLMKYGTDDDDDDDDDNDDDNDDNDDDGSDDKCKNIGIGVVTRNIFSTLGGNGNGNNVLNSKPKPKPKPKPKQVQVSRATEVGPVSMSLNGTFEIPEVDSSRNSTSTSSLSVTGSVTSVSVNSTTDTIVASNSNSNSNSDSDSGVSPMHMYQV
jgi:hypothetical protein